MSTRDESMPNESEIFSENKTVFNVYELRPKKIEGVVVSIHDFGITVQIESRKKRNRFISYHMIKRAIVDGEDLCPGVNITIYLKPTKPDVIIGKLVRTVGSCGLIKYKARKEKLELIPFGEMLDFSQITDGDVKEDDF